MGVYLGMLARNWQGGWDCEHKLLSSKPNSLNFFQDQKVKRKYRLLYAVRFCPYFSCEMTAQLGVNIAHHQDPITNMTYGEPQYQIPLKRSRIPLSRGQGGGKKRAKNMAMRRYPMLSTRKNRYPGRIITNISSRM